MQFQLQINLKVGKVTFYQFLCVIVHGLSVIQDFKFILPIVFTCIRYDLYKAIRLSRRISGRIFKFKRAIKQRKHDFTYFRVLYLGMLPPYFFV